KTINSPFILAKRLILKLICKRSLIWAMSRSIWWTHQGNLADAAALSIFIRSLKLIQYALSYLMMKLTRSVFSMQKPNDRWKKSTLFALARQQRCCSQTKIWRSEEHTSELQSRFDLVCRLLLEKKKTKIAISTSHAIT